MALELALAADIRIASEDCVLGLPEIAFGLVPDVGGTTRLVRTVGEPRARELVLTGRMIRARTAERYGLVHDVVADAAALEQRVLARAELLASHAPTALGLAKVLVQASGDSARDELPARGCVPAGADRAARSRAAVRPRRSRSSRRRWRIPSRVGGRCESVVPEAWRARCARVVAGRLRVCYCAALPTLATRTRIVILQHPRERDMPIGTARMAQLCLPEAELHVGIRWGESAAFATRDQRSGAAGDPAVARARPRATSSRDPPLGPVTLVVVDGTWSQAKTVVRDNPCLQALPRYAFATPEPSQYRIRKEPRAEYVSTIEALMHVLGVLEA